MYLLVKTLVLRSGVKKDIILGYTNTAAEAYMYADKQNHINTNKYFYKASIRYTFKSLIARYHQIVYSWSELKHI